MSDTRLLNAQEVGERLGLTRHQVYRRLQRGDIPSTMGGWNGLQYLVDPADLEDYIAAGQPLTSPARDRSMLTVPEVAKLTGLTRETVRNLCYRGVLKFVRTTPGKSGHLRITKASVRKYLADRENDL